MGAIDIGAQVAEFGIGQLTAKQQFERQKKIMDIQSQKQQEMMDLQKQNQMQLNEQGQQIQLDTWEKTNYPAQVAMLKSAGLNPSLLYAKGGAGGVTGGQGGGSASGGSATGGQASEARPMNIANILQMEAIRSQTNANTAGARKTNAEAEILEKYGSGQAGAEIQSKEAGARKAGEEAENIKIDTAIKQIEYANTQRQIDTRVENTAELTNKLKLENAITAETYDSIIKRTQAEAIGATLDNELTTSRIKLTDTEKQAIVTGIVQKWTQLNQENRKLDIEQFSREIQAEYPTAGQVIGGIAKKAYKSLQNIENLFKGGAQPIQDRVK